MNPPTQDRNDTSNANFDRADVDRRAQVDMDGEDRTGRPRRFTRLASMVSPRPLWVGVQ